MITPENPDEHADRVCAAEEKLRAQREAQLTNPARATDLVKSAQLKLSQLDTRADPGFR